MVKRKINKEGGGDGYKCHDPWSYANGGWDCSSKFVTAIYLFIWNYGELISCFS